MAPEWLFLFWGLLGAVTAWRIYIATADKVIDLDQILLLANLVFSGFMLLVLFFVRYPDIATAAEASLPQ